MSRALPASLVSATIMRQCHTGAVTPRWVGRSVGVRRGPIMRDKLSQTSASWRWADGVWRRPRRGGFPHEPAEAKAEGKAEEDGEERPAPQNAEEKKKKKRQKCKRETAAYKTLIKPDGQLVSLHTEAGSVFRFIFYFIFLLRLRFGRITGAAATFSRCTSGLKGAKVCDSKEKRSSLGERENIDVHTVFLLFWPPPVMTPLF